MSVSYETESEKLAGRIAELRSMMSAWDKRNRGAEQFAELVAQYSDITELSAELLNALVEKIVVHEREIVDGRPVVRLEIYYRFVGSVGNENGDGLMAKKLHGKRYIAP